VGNGGRDRVLGNAMLADDRGRDLPYDQPARLPCHGGKRNGASDSAGTDVPELY